MFIDFNWFLGERCGPWTILNFFCVGRKWLLYSFFHTAYIWYYPDRLSARKECIMQCIEKQFGLKICCRGLTYGRFLIKQSFISWVGRWTDVHSDYIIRRNCTYLNSFSSYRFLSSNFILRRGEREIEVYQWLKLRNIYMQSGFPDRCQVITVSWLLKNELKKSHQMKEIAMHVVKTNCSEANWDTFVIYRMLSHWWKELAKW